MRGDRLDYVKQAFGGCTTGRGRALEASMAKRPRALLGRCNKTRMTHQEIRYDSPMGLLRPAIDIETTHLPLHGLRF